MTVDNADCEKLLEETAAYWERMMELLKYSGLPLLTENADHGHHLKEYLANIVEVHMSIETCDRKLSVHVLCASHIVLVKMFFWWFSDIINGQIQMNSCK